MFDEDLNRTLGIFQFRIEILLNIFVRKGSSLKTALFPIFKLIFSWFAFSKVNPWFRFQ